MRTVRSRATTMLITAVALFVLPCVASASIGGGVHYLKTVGEIKDSSDFDENAIGFMASLRIPGNALQLEADVEFVPNFMGSDKLLTAPQGYLLLGSLIYAGAGVGISHIADFGWQDPFYALRAGVNLDTGSIELDIFATYRFEKAKDLEGFDSDELNALTLGVLVRF